MNSNIKNIQTQLLSDEVKPLHKVSFDKLMKDNKWHPLNKEVYETGDAATILLYNEINQTIILTKQFRIPTYLNQNPDGVLLETCAGKLDNDSPEACIIREVEEETGYRIKVVQRIFEGYTSPASLTEKLYCFVGAYDASMKVSAGGGLKEEGEEIDVLEYSYNEAFELMDHGNINDIKTLLLLQYLRWKIMAAEPK